MTVAMTLTKAAISCVPMPGRARCAALSAGAGVVLLLLLPLLLATTGAATVVGVGAPCGTTFSQEGNKIKASWWQTGFRQEGN
jgi:hypothetical protein